jgi:hypothetical protein
MAATDPSGAQKFWVIGGGTFDTLAISSRDAGTQKWWTVPKGPGGLPVDFVLAGIVPVATPPVSGYRFPALTVAG